MDYVVWFENLTKDSLSVAGGKGANLGEMTRLRLPVPPGFAITTRAFDTFLEVNKIKEKIQQLIQETNVDDTQQLLNTSNRVKQLIISAEISIDIRNAILQAYKNLSFTYTALREIINPEAVKLISAGRDFALVAVRSSATAEDLPSIGAEDFALVSINGNLIFDKMPAIYEKYENSKKPGEKCEIFVPSLDGNKIKWLPAIEMYRHLAQNAKLVKVKTKSGRSITITPNHSLITLDANNWNTTTTSIYELKKETRIPVIKYLPFPYKKVQKVLEVSKVLSSKPLLLENGRVKIREGRWQIQNDFPAKIKINKEFVYFLGVYAAEGSTYGKNCIDVSCESEIIVRRLKKYLKSIGLETNKDEKNVRLFNRVLVELLKTLTGEPLPVKGKGRSARIKKVPNLIFNQNEEVIAEFLKGCFDGDGYVVKQGVGYTSVSKALIAGIVKLLELLRIKCYISKENTIIIPVAELKVFLKKIGFSDKRNIRKMKSFLKEYKKLKKHFDFIDTSPPSKMIAEVIQREIKSKVNLKKIKVAVCPKCEYEMIKNGKSSSGKQRYMCKNCHISISGKFQKIKEVYKIPSYNEFGRFKKGMTPWNFGNRTARTYGISYLKKIARRIKSKELIEIANSDVIWDKIKKTEKIDYSGYVYDFVVPKTQNFAAGIGGIITHNTASFAGQQASFLNVRGMQNFLEAVKKCWASLYEPRAIFYRAKNNVQSASISVLVQRMINSEKSGVMFTINPMTGESNVVIEATWGLGESLVLGAVEPDTYFISRNGELIEKRIGRKERMKIREISTDRTVDLPVATNKVSAQVLTEDELARLVEYGVMLENHYSKPQDVEFAIEKGKIYIVQTRAVTTNYKEEEVEKSLREREEREERGEVILSGLGSSPGIATGIVRIVHGMQDISKVQKGDILVTTMTTPDLVPAMAKSAAIVTDQGGLTAHASIVGREMGLPVIVGTNDATKVLREGMRVTVDAYAGKVYAGEVAIHHEAAAHEERWTAGSAGTQVEMPSEEELMKTATVTKVKVNLVFPERAAEVARFADGVGLLRIEHMITKAGVHPAKLIREGRSEEYEKILMDGIRPIAATFVGSGKPVWVRTLDARSDEFRNLQGGESEPHEDNSMLGWHGIRRSLDEPDLLRAEFTAIKRLHDEGLTNIGVMLPFVISVDEFSCAREIAKEVGLPEEVKIGIMIETPAAVMIVADFCKAGIDFISFGSNDLTQLTLGIDRNNAKIASSFSEMHPAVRKMLRYAIKICKSFHVETSICGEGPSNIPELVDFLVECGIDSISVEIDALHRVRARVMQKEKMMLIDAMRKR